MYGLDCQHLALTLGAELSYLLNNSTGLYTIKGILINFI